MMNFDKYNWHDTIVRSINIDRSTPGINDEISFEIEWTDGEICLLKFKNVYWSSMTLNFGIIAEDSILDAKILDKNDADLQNFHSKWKGLLDHLSLNIFYIELNTSGSIIKIIAEGYELMNY